MARFQYNTLPLGEDEIRLLKLLPESMPSTFQPVKTELIRCNIDRPPTFKALSYMWGDEDNRRDIEVGDAMLSITASLDMALRALRSQTEQVLFWIDQICINQNDTAEKNLQIPLMTRIYTIAIQTVGWIGPACSDIDVASVVSSLDDIGVRGRQVGLESVTAEQWRLLYTNELENAFGTTYATIDDIRDKLQYQLKEMGDLQSLPHIKGMAWFFGSQYFQRGWIQQEIAIPEKLVFRVGHVEIDADKLVAAALLLELYNHHTSRPLRSQATSQTDEMIQSIESMFTSLHNNIVPCLAIRRQYQLSNEERYFNLASILRKYSKLTFGRNMDRVYGTLGLARDVKQLGLQVNVDLPWDIIFTDTAKRIIQTEITDDNWRSGVNFMALCNFPKTNAKLPSWVPDLTSIGSLMTLAEATMNFSAQPFNASRGFGQHSTQQSLKPYAVSCSGITIDTIMKVGRCWPVSPSGEKTLEGGIKTIISDIGEFAKKSIAIVTSDNNSRHPHRSDQAKLSEAAWRVPILDQEFGGNAVANRRATNYSFQGYNAIMTMYGNKNAFISYKTGVEPLKSRRPFLGGSGFVGIGPVGIQTGDIVCVLRGGRFPFVLRKKVPAASAIGSISEFELVGEAYCHGIMDGEALQMGMAIEEFTLV